MKVQKEGLKIYRIEESVQNEYFLSVEYQTLRLNQMETLLPVLLREKNGKRMLLYDITEVKNLITIAEVKGFTWKDCQQFLRDILCLTSEMEEFMFEMEHVSFEPDQIYRKDNGHFQWMYLPDQSVDLRKGIEGFFAWMLSRIDYGDSQSVRYIYHVYWSIRNRGFSREMVEECIDYTEEEKKTEIASYEGSFTEKKNQEIVSDTMRDEGKSGIGWIVLLVVLSLLLISDMVITIYLIVVWIQNKLPKGIIPYLAGAAISSLFLADGIIHIWRRWCDRKGEKVEKGCQNDVPEIDRDDEGKTTVLSVRKDMVQPALKDVDTGEITGVYTFPFYIGNLSGLNQLIIDDDTVSRRHAVILKGKQTGTYMIQDLQSTNGTWVEEERLVPDKPVKLERGARICFASCVFEFMLVDSSIV